MPKRRWAVVLEGTEGDLKDWAHLLPLGFDPWVEVNEGRTILHSADFDSLDSMMAVEAHAVWLIRMLSGAIAIVEEPTSVRPGSVLEYTPDGGAVAHSRGIAHGRARARAYSSAVVIRDGIVVPTEPQRTEPQRWAAIAANDEHLADALIFFGGSQDWFDMYKAIESLERSAGSVHALRAKGWAPEEEVRTLKESVNWHRHYRGNDPQPTGHYDRDQAIASLTRLIARAFAARDGA
jgi:hypothetical protein